MNAESEIPAAPAERETALRIDFGKDGNGAEFMGEGWSNTEWRFRWMTGAQSELSIRPGLVAADYILELELHPMVSPPVLPTQRLTVSVNGIAIGHSTIAHDGRYGYRIPAAALAGRQATSITFTHPDGARPCDVRQSNDKRLLSVSLGRLSASRIRHGLPAGSIQGTGGISPAELERRLGMDPARFMLNFESLGDNCEFGLVQRRCGAEAFFSLLRFAGMELPTLLRALDLGMEDFADEANVEIRVDDKPRPEFVVHENRYRVFFHTFRYQDEAQPEPLLASERKRLAYCAQRLLGDMRKGTKIFVLKRNDELLEEEILPVYRALESFGVNDLLWVVPADAEHPPGTVEAVLPGLYKGYVGRFGPYDNAPDFKLEDWLEVCANAYWFWRADRTSQTEAEPGGAIQAPQHLGMRQELTSPGQESLES